MIVGMGSDITDIRRIEKTLDKYGERFIKRVFSDIEIQKAERRRSAGTHIATYAKRFAAKEACSKALGTGFNNGVFMKDISVENDASGKPNIVLRNGALSRAQKIVPEGKKFIFHLTLTDEPPFAMAHVILEAV